MNAVTCLKWVRKGAAKPLPDQVKLTQEEMTDLVQGMKKTALDEDSEEDEEEDLPRKRKLKHTSSQKESKASPSKETENGADNDTDSDASEDESNPLNMAGVTFYAKPSDDPYLSKEPDSDDDLEILSGDNLITLGKVNKDDCNLEVYVYNEQEGNCWCHHDYILPTIPLCLEWLDFDPGSENHSNFVAVGSMSPDIELWDLDVLETLEPAFVLTGDHGKKSSKSGKKKKRKSKGHSDAILDLSWNRNQRQALASASADFSLGLWDLEQGEMVTSFPHEEKVQCIEWHPTDPYSIVSGCADSTVKLFDCRNLEPDVIQWKVTGEVENVMWDHSKPDCFIASSDAGIVYCFDKRQTSKPLSEFQAHEDSVTGLSFSSSLKGCLVTCSADKTIKMWDINPENPTLVFSKDIKIGQLFCVADCPDASLLYAVGGERELKVLNLKKNPKVIEHFNLGNKDEGSDDIDVPIEGGMDGHDVLDEIDAASSADVVKRKKTHRGRKHKKNISEPVDGGPSKEVSSGNAGGAGDAQASSSAASDSNVSQTSTKKKKKKKKKNKDKVNQSTD